MSPAHGPCYDPVVTRVGAGLDGADVRFLVPAIVLAVSMIPLALAVGRAGRGGATPR